MDDQQLTRMYRRFLKAFDSEALENEARASGFTERVRSISPHQLVVSLVTAMATQNTETIADVVRTFNAMTGAEVAYKPFHNQLAKEAFPEFMRRVVCALLGELTSKVLTPSVSSKLNAFKDLVVQDGSSFALHPALRHEFPGRFTTVSPAAVEVHATMNLFSDQVSAVSIAPDAVGERHFLPAPADLEGRLLLGDRGYEDIDYCAAVANAGGYFIIRCKRQLNPRIVRCDVGGKIVKSYEGKRLHDVRDKLRGKSADIWGEWTRRGGRVLRFRVVLAWNPKQRQHMILMTNLDATKFPPEDILLLYRLRWQIELVFKEWKSYANLHKFATTKAPIAEGLMWAALAAALLKRFLAHATQLIFRGVETSTRRTAMAIRHALYGLMQAMVRGQRGVRAAFRSLVAFLSHQAQRAHPKRDRKSGRLRPGLCPVHGGQREWPLR